MRTSQCEAIDCRDQDWRSREENASCLPFKSGAQSLPRVLQCAQAVDQSLLIASLGDCSVPRAPVLLRHVATSSSPFQKRFGGCWSVVGLPRMVSGWAPYLPTLLPVQRANYSGSRNPKRNGHPRLVSCPSVLDRGTHDQLKRTCNIYNQAGCTTELERSGTCARRSGTLYENKADCVCGMPNGPRGGGYFRE